MILKKPYAFFIKIFKPIHLLISVLTVFFMYRTNNILKFFSNYIYSNDNVVGENISEILISNSIYVIPIIMIIVSLIFLGIMFRKQKPIVFYIFTIFSCLIVIIINIYISNFLGIMEQSIVSIKVVKLAHDLVFINMIIEILIFVLFTIRGLGLNFKKFNFDADITKLNINESDREEIELNLNVDLDLAKRKRKRNLRYLKYRYKENKFLINSTIILVAFILSLVAFKFYFSSNQNKIEGNLYSINGFNLRVNKSIFLNHDFNNNKITDNYLVIVDIDLQTNLNKINLYLKDFSLEVGEAIFPVETKYSSKLIDIGNTYDEQMLSSEFLNYIFTFEIPIKYIESDLFFVYTSNGVRNKIKLNPQNYETKKVIKIVNLNERINFKETLGNIEFVINSFEIADKFLIKYNYCINKNDCIKSKEYIKPTINENFDKYVLKMNVDYTNNSNLNIKSFYDFFSKFAVIEYKIGDKIYYQNSKFEELTSKKIKNKNDIYIGINSDIALADSINLNFNVRDSNYTYVLK